ncbi:solute carrier family 2, facilitated glucose transporter member 5-like [Amphiura filiformis]|uniref:solute carrier family 2, facilitated glucose transporter member 5-like n=1 Tax=Amphiura filiformis TaxID=82378 RepID=UPI003B21795E
MLSILVYDTVCLFITGSGSGKGEIDAEKEMKQFFNQSNFDRRGEYLTDNALLWLWSFTLSFFCVGCALGAYTASYLADRLGRRTALVVNNVFSIIASIMFGVSLVANNYEMIMIARIIYGFYAGTAVTVVPLYLSEISPVNLRGAIGTLHQLMITLGIFTSQVCKAGVSQGSVQGPLSH